MSDLSDTDLPSAMPRLDKAIDAIEASTGQLLTRLGGALHENDRLRRLLTYQLSRVDELKRRLSMYRERTEAVEIARLRGVIHRLKAQVEGQDCMPSDWLSAAIGRGAK